MDTDELRKQILIIRMALRKCADALDWDQDQENVEAQHGLAAMSDGLRRLDEAQAEWASKVERAWTDEDYEAMARMESPSEWVSDVPDDEWDLLMAQGFADD